MSRRGRNKYEELKNWLLSRRLIAYAVLVFVVLAATIPFVDNIIELGSRLSTRAHLAIYAGAATRTVEIYDSIPLTIEVVLSTSDPTPIEDARITFQFYHKGGDRIAPEEVVRYFSLASNDLHVPVLTNAINRRAVSSVIRPRRSGHFVVRILAISEARKLKAETGIDLMVDDYRFSVLPGLAPKDSPLFIVRNGLLDSAPLFLSSLGEFKAVIVEEVYRSNVAKGTVWFQPDYVGALGGSVRKILRDTLDREDASATASEAYLKDPYAGHLLKRIQEVSTLEDVGFVGDVVPIGSSFYEVKGLDDQTMMFRKVEVECKEVTIYSDQTGKAFKSIGLDPAGDGKPLRWRVASPALSFSLVAHSCGATGRNCVTELSINGKRYSHYHVAENRANLASSDFPVWIKHSDTHFLKFSLGDSALKLVIFDCDASNPYKASDVKGKK